MKDHNGRRVPRAYPADALVKGQDEDGEATEEEQAAECTNEGMDFDAAASKASEEAPGYHMCT